MVLCSRSLLITFTVRVTKQHPVNISFLTKTSAAHYRGTMPSKNRNKTSVPVFYRRIKYPYSFICARTRTYILFRYYIYWVPMFYFLNKICFLHLSHGIACVQCNITISNNFIQGSPRTAISPAIVF